MDDQTEPNKLHMLQLSDDHPMVVAFDKWNEQVCDAWKSLTDADRLWTAFSAGYEAAPQPPRFEPIDRNYQAIAMLALAAHAVVEGFDPDDILPPSPAAIENVMAIARGDELSDPPPSAVFQAVVRTALDMYEGHGGLAIEHLIDLGEFMLNEMGYEPAGDGEAILDSVKRKMIEMRDYIEASEQAKGIARKVLAENGGDVGKASEAIAALAPGKTDTVQ